MPIPFLSHVVFGGIPGGYSYWSVLKVIAVFSALAVVKWYCNGATNSSERQMHSKVVIITVGLLNLSLQQPILIRSR